MEHKSVSEKNIKSLNPQNKKNVKDMTLEEQVQYYKNMFQKSKTLNKFYDEEIKKLKSKYECEDGQVCDLIMKFQYDTDIFYLFKDNKKKYFINENTLAKESIEQLKNNTSIKLYDFEKDLKNKDIYLTQIINQYEDKIKKLNEEKESLNNKLTSILNQQDNFKNIIDKENLFFENIIKTMIEKTSEINIQLKNVFNIDNYSNDNKLIKEVYSKIKENIDNLKSININDNKNQKNNMNIWLNELNNLIISLLYELLDNNFKIIENEKIESQDKNKYQKTIDEILLNHQEEKNKLFTEIEESRNKMKSLYLKIQELEKDKSNLTKEKDNSIQKLNKQINSGANLNYLKNIMISFLSSKDKSIQEGLLPVIYKSLDFKENEIKTVQEERSKNSHGFFSYFTSN